MKPKTLTDDQGGLYLVEDDTPEDDQGYPLATLWLPNPDTHHGWEMRHVWAQKPRAPQVRPSKRPMGYRVS